MKRNIPRRCLAAVVVFFAMAVAGCGKKEAEITKGITPDALNFYILHQEIGAIRDKVGAVPAGQMPQYLPSYQELLVRTQKMLKENAVSKELKKYPLIASAMDTCLAVGAEFLVIETKAVGINGRLADVRQELADIRQSVRNNSLLAKKQKPKIDALTEQEARLQKDLEQCRPRLMKGSQAGIAALRNYNKLILESKILEYANDEKIFSLMAWEKPAAAKPAAKPVKKKRR